MANKEPTGRVAGRETIVGEGTAQERIGATSGVSVTNHSGACYRLASPTAPPSVARRAMHVWFGTGELARVPCCRKRYQRPIHHRLELMIFNDDTRTDPNLWKLEHVCPSRQLSNSSDCRFPDISIFTIPFVIHNQGRE